MKCERRDSAKGNPNRNANIKKQGKKLFFLCFSSIFLSMSVFLTHTLQTGRGGATPLPRRLSCGSSDGCSRAFFGGEAPEIPPFGRTRWNVPVLSCRMPLLTDREARICVCCRAAHLGFCWSGEGSLVCLFCCLPLPMPASPVACLSCCEPFLLSAFPAVCLSCCLSLLLRASLVAYPTRIGRNRSAPGVSAGRTACSARRMRHSASTNL